MLFFFFKQKTAYEMRISDWSSDVCSSDLMNRPPVSISALATPPIRKRETAIRPSAPVDANSYHGSAQNNNRRRHYGREFLIGKLVQNKSNNCYKIGRASCRERVCQYV